MKFGRIVLQTNTHRLTKSDFDDVILSGWRPWRSPLLRSLGLCNFYACSSVRRLPASTPTACIQFLTHSTFVLVLTTKQTWAIWKNLQASNFLPHFHRVVFALFNRFCPLSSSGFRLFYGEACARRGRTPMKIDGHITLTSSVWTRIGT